MTDFAIKVRGLGKRFHTGKSKSADFRTSIGYQIKSIFRVGKMEKESFWALQDINFEIARGESLGIIGCNGAGKSTLLKILSRITAPTTGMFEINGRVSSLLEIGTGFHMELTGRENIYLNGTILGMKRKEIRKKFDEIVSFSGVEKFLDTPVKHYSSGMKVRLAFSVAAHLEPEILIVDEVLAVGDAAFQKKCLGKMSEVTRNEGRTILFVSHNMNALKSICSKGIVIRNGKIDLISDISNSINRYSANEETLTLSRTLKNAFIGDGIYIEDFTLSKHTFEVFSDMEIELKMRFLEENMVSELALLINNETGERVAIIDMREYLEGKKTRSLEFQGVINKMPLLEGHYSIGLYLLSNLATGNYQKLIKFSITGKETKIPSFPLNVRGYVELENKFN
jgi:lipopolysaccharide transport system ATP-binding protein